MFLSLQRGCILIGEVTVEVIEQKMWYEEWYGIVLILFLIFAIPIGLGRSIAQAVRMRDYSWKIALVLFSALAASVMLVVREPNLGIDLGGGIILEYEIDQQKKDEVVAAGQNQGLMEDMVDSVRQRLDPAGVRQVSIRESGAERIEIKIPRVSQAEIALLKRKLVTVRLQSPGHAGPRFQRDGQVGCLMPGILYGRVELQHQVIDQLTVEAFVIARSDGDFFRLR